MSTKRFLGQAASVADLWTVSLSGTVISQTYSFTINAKTISYTASGSDTVATILAALVSLWNQLTPANPPEFNELIAAGLPVVGPFTSMTLTGLASGKPSTISVATGGAATFSIANTTPATGPNFFDNGQNWSGGVAPVNSDVLVFDNGSTPCKYNISTSLTGITVNVNTGYTGQIGLPFINADSSVTYNEYRTTSLTLAGGTAVINSTQIGRCNLAFGANTTTVRVLATGQRADQNTPVVLIQGGNSSSEIDVSKGDVSLAFYQGQSATFHTVNLGYTTTPASDVQFIAGLGSVLTTVSKNGGIAKIQSSATTITQGVSGGSLTLTDSSAVTTLNVYAGTCYLKSIGTIATINLYGSATLSCDADPRAHTITNPINVYSPLVTITDNAKSINSGTLSLATNGCASVNVGHGGNATIVYT